MKLKREENSFQNTNSEANVNASTAHATRPNPTNTMRRPVRRRVAGHSQATSANGRIQNAPTARS